MIVLETMLTRHQREGRSGLALHQAISRSTMASLLLLLLITSVATLAELAAEDRSQQQPKATGICAMQGCNCTVKAHHWIFVKCVFSDDQDVDLAEGMIPEDAMEVEVSRCRELRIQAGAFTGGPQLKRVYVSGISTLVANRQAFQNLSAPNPLLEVFDCQRVILESHAFKNSKGPLSVAISRCRHVTIKPNAFSWLLQITMKEIYNLELSSNAFKFETPQLGRHGPATKIVFQSIKMPELPTAAFPSTAAEIRMDDLRADIIRKDAFSAMSILSVIISNATIGEIETGAFSDKTLIHGLEFVDVRLDTIRTGAFRAGANNLTIQYSRLSDVETGAIDIAVATATFNNNEFERLRRKSITFHQWNRVTIDNNLFKHIESDAISAITEDIAKSPNLEFSFSGNQIHESEENSLNFIEIFQSVTAARVGRNYFKKTCHCFLEKWVRERVGSNTSVTWIMDSSYCMVDKFLRDCFNLPEGYLGMRNYTQTICSKNTHGINCPNKSAKPDTTASPPSVGPHHYARGKNYLDIEMSDMEQMEREKRIIIIVCMVAVFAMLIVILTSGVLYMRRRGVCPKLTSGSLNITDSWFSPNSGMTAATSARSISRLSVAEYAGLQTETRILDIETHQDASEDDEGAAEAGHNYAYMENKATQTLPEELTEEYLRDLREKLNDPENYGHAKDMIEHLYDLIKVEESCNNNNADRRASGDDNAYAVIRPKRTRIGPRQPSVNMGTKTPSLDKLLPTLARPYRPQITEYAEPRDRRIVDQNHVYDELPGDETIPSTSRLTQPVLATLAGRAQQPLPPDVVNGHAKQKENSHSQYAMELGENGFCGNSQRSENSLKENERRPKNFFRTVSDTLKGPKKGNNKRPSSLLGEYSEPCEDTAHLYAELPDPKLQLNSSISPSKMANRPLPTKPSDQQSKSPPRP
ncbi:hypothetical protein QAD02_008641 [Eretmocerus hayati]|uniref:Uncharacterized protein n=1 Tax=Eretmocerus hayati TaxID=131215 RepID=A0ACC2N9H1_9HYME|nr:hypothetical protein QAD02_008641 [Eretmocerus hayati]